MQFRHLLLLAAIVAAVAAAPGGSSSSSSDADYDKYKSVSDLYKDENAYKDKPHFRPSWWERRKAGWEKFKGKVKHLFGCIAHSFHEHWLNFKSDIGRFVYWGQCKKEHFARWYRLHKEIRAGKRKIKCELEREYFETFCKFKREKKDEYKKREKECEGLVVKYDAQSKEYMKSSSDACDVSYQETAAYKHDKEIDY